MDTLWKLCAGKNKRGALEADLQGLTRQVAYVCAAQEKGAVKMQATKDAEAAKKVDTMLVLKLTEKPVG